ncbi:putative acetyltransferase [Kibdelosporangium banguiense]|uniref:Acetyltransferase n=1 Tax=Kibdelosporangium banguiense TaxID=1365924 RepID=A0ABS4TMP2_9PSEU|nr:GNAT family N-acetyltransferase [Kibdelosporangium banguiense]MBP2325683.1 putative acetyltransferase [Kibdelosporangium banguiense]
MTDFAVRVLTEDAEIRAAHTVLAVALHNPPLTDERWKQLKPTYAPERYFGAVTDVGVVASTYIFDSSVVVPGGNVVPMAAVSRVGVRADFTRRGVLTELMRFHLADAKARGQIFGGLHASEAVIYGRFGYGVSTSARHLRLRRARVRPGLPREGRMRMLGAEEAVALIPVLHERVGFGRPGTMSRGRDWWATQFDRTMRGDEPYQVYVHSGPDGDDGYVIYESIRNDNTDSMDHGAVIQLWELWGTTQQVRNELWQFMLGIDLVREIQAYNQPLDEGVELLLADPRTCHTNELDDELWLRLIDVPAALAARTYGDADPVVLSVNDAFLPENSGTYQVSHDGVSRTSEPAAFTVDVDVLAMMYLGAWRPTALAAAGRLQVNDPQALSRADRLFATDTVAWCGTGF